MSINLTRKVSKSEDENVFSNNNTIGLNISNVDSVVALDEFDKIIKDIDVFFKDDIECLGDKNFSKAELHANINLSFKAYRDDETTKIIKPVEVSQDPVSVNDMNDEIEEMSLCDRVEDFKEGDIDEEIDESEDEEDEIRYAFEEDVGETLVNEETGRTIYLDEGLDALFDAIDFRLNTLDSRLTENGYLESNPHEYLKNEYFLIKISDYFKSHPILSGPLSLRERSHEIFGDEKFLLNNKYLSILNNIGITKDILKIDGRNEPLSLAHDLFPTHITGIAPTPNILICENKDIYTLLKKTMYCQSSFKIFGRKFQGILYGGGTQILEKGKLFEQYCNQFRRNANFIYWSDIDRSGFRDYLKLKKLNPELPISLFQGGYEAMLDLSAKKEIIRPVSHPNKVHNVNIANEICLFRKDRQDLLLDILKKDKIIPQEVINHTTLKIEKVSS